jgi:2-polyprenyl-6-methoxyphenol hydroxylase-like FAD-dependent oxidoreductase
LTSTPSPRIVVVGAGIAGLSVTLALARAGRAVTLLERDGAAPPADATGMWSAWPRPGTPQAHHIHGFLARSRAVLRDRAPDVLASMLAIGIAEMDLAARAPGGPGQPGDQDLVSLRSRRPVFEGVLRRAVEAEPNVDLRATSGVAGLLARAGGRAPRVVGVRTRAGEEVAADLVVDASGRTSRVRAWLAEIGARPPAEDSCDSGLVYYNRTFALRPGAEPPPTPVPISTRGDLPYLGYASGPGDNRTFVWNLVVPSWDRELRALRRDEAWMAAAAAIPALAPWVEPARSEPVGPVEAMGQLRCMLRRFVVDGQPVAPGLHVLGDALCHTTPTFGYGASLGRAHGFALADAIEATPGDPVAQALAFDAAVGEETRGAYDFAVASDRARIRAFRGQARSDDVHHFAYTELPWAAAVDPVLYRAVARHQHLLVRPGTLVEDDALMARARATVATLRRAGRPPRRPSGPSREELLELISASTASDAA